MKKIALSLVALAAVSTVAFANNSRELRESDTYFGKYSEQVKDNAPAVNAFAVANDGQALTAFERMKQISEETTVSRH